MIHDTYYILEVYDTVFRHEKWEYLGDGDSWDRTFEVSGVVGYGYELIVNSDSNILSIYSRIIDSNIDR